MNYQQKAADFLKTSLRLYNPINHFYFDRDVNDLAAALEAAVREERERAARVIDLEQEFIQVAETNAMNNRYGITNRDTIHSAWVKVVKFFAAAIRKGEP